MANYFREAQAINIGRQKTTSTVGDKDHTRFDGEGFPVLEYETGATDGEGFPVLEDETGATGAAPAYHLTPISPVKGKRKRDVRTAAKAVAKPASVTKKIRRTTMS